MWFDLLLPLISFVTGWSVAYLMYRRFTGAGEIIVASLPAAPALTESPADHEKAVAEAAEYLRLFAGTLAANVDAHQTKVQAVNDSLLESTGHSSSEVICVAVNRLIEANETMQRQLQSAQDQIQTQASQLETAERRAQTDGLTRVGNRRAFDDHLAHRFALGAGQAGTLALFDIDHFKQLNDTHGHRAGDEVLRIVANLLHARMSPHGLVARYGGEEFAVVLDGYPIERSIPLLEEVRQAIGLREVVFENKRLRVSASAGMAELMSGETAENWLQRTDDCLYQSKRAGRNCGHWADGGTCRLITSPSHEPASPDAGPPRASDSPIAGAATEADEAPAEEATDEAPEIEDSVREAMPELPVPGNLFPYLPDRVTLRETLRELSQQRRGARMPMTVMAIRLAEHVSGPASRSLLQIVRATARGIDRIGCEAPSTLIYCLPNTDVEGATERALQIHCSTETVRLPVGEGAAGRHLGIGIAACAQVDDFEETFRAAQPLAEAALDDRSQPVQIATGETVS